MTSPSTSPYRSTGFRSCDSSPRTTKRRKPIPSQSPGGRQSSPPLLPVSTDKKIRAVASGVFLGLCAGIIAGSIGLLLTAIVSIPLVVEESQTGFKFVAQKIVETLIFGIGSTSSLLLSIRIGLNVGKGIHDSIIRG